MHEQTTDQLHSHRPRLRLVSAWTIAVTVIAEVVTIIVRFTTGTSAAEVNRNLPLFLQLHHMFWGIPLFCIVPIVWRHRRISSALLGIGAGLVFSDLLHHFVVLPLTVGNTGWHWP